MLIPVEVLGLVTRTVSTVDLDGVPARRTVMTRTFPTDRDDLWDAVTNPARIPRWLMPISGDLKVGGSYQLEGNAGGTVEECEAPERFRVTWQMGPATTWLTVTLTSDGDAGTQLRLEHVGVVPEELWAQFGPSATGIGWDMMLLALGLHTSSGEAVDPAEAAAWTASPEGVAMTEQSALLWQDADAAAGTDPDAAAQRAAFTVAVYTGRAEPSQS